MKSIFLKIYASVLCCTLFIAAASYLTLDLANQQRYQRYISNTMGGTFSLIAEGINRHKGDKRNEWIETVEKLTGLALTVGPLTDKEDYNRHSIGQTQESIYIQSNLSYRASRIALKIENEQFLITNIDDINHALTRISALLILNELGRHHKENRNSALANLQARFSYPLSLVTQSSLTLDTSQWRQLQRGDTVTNFLNRSSSTPTLEIFAPFGNSGLFLQLGPIPVFQWYPMSLILPLVSFVIIALLLLSFFYVNTLAGKLNTLEKGIKLAGTESFNPISLKGKDAFSTMANNINDMAIRIDQLVTQQRVMTNDISHELRTPVARMMFRVENLIDAKPDIDTNVLGLQKDLASLNAMIDEMLDFAKLDHVGSLRISHFNLFHHCAAISENLMQLHPHVSFNLNIPHNYSIPADKTLFLRAIENLLINACRHCHQVVSIGVLITLHDGLSIIIEDDGPGIAQKHRERIFDPFIRLDNSRQASDGGYGLGLSIVKRIAQLHRGKITIDDSPNLGGAAFALWLPNTTGKDTRVTLDTSCYKFDTTST